MCKVSSLGCLRVENVDLRHTSLNDIGLGSLDCVNLTKSVELTVVAKL